MPTAGTASSLAGLVSLVLLTASVLCGITVSLRRRVPRFTRYPSRKLHEYASLAALGFLALHIVFAVTGPFSRVPVIAAIDPLGLGNIWLGLGAIAGDVLVVLIATSVVRRRIGRRAWRAVHWSSYACWPAAEAHSLGITAAMRSGRLFDLAIACLAAVVLAAGWRLAVLISRPARRRPPAGRSSSRRSAAAIR